MLQPEPILASYGPHAYYGSSHVLCGIDFTIHAATKIPQDAFDNSPSVPGFTPACGVRQGAPRHQIPTSAA